MSQKPHICVYLSNQEFEFVRLAAAAEGHTRSGFVQNLIALRQSEVGADRDALLDMVRYVVIANNALLNQHGSSLISEAKKVYRQKYGKTSNAE